MTNNAHSNVTEFQKALSELYSLSAKVEGASLALLAAMHESEVTFSLEWLETFMRSDKKVDMLDAVLDELVPVHKEIREAAKAKIKAKDGVAKALSIQNKEDAQKKYRTAIQTMRNVIFALLYLRASEVTTLIKIKSRMKLKVGDTYLANVGFSVSEMIKYGKEEAERRGWIEVKTASNTTNSGSMHDAEDKGISVAETGARAASTAGTFPNAIAEMCKALVAVLKAKPYESMSDEEVHSFRTLENALIVATYGDKKGNVDLEMLATQYAPMNKKTRAA